MNTYHFIKVNVCGSDYWIIIIMQIMHHYIANEFYVSLESMLLKLLCEYTCICELNIMNTMN